MNRWSPAVLAILLSALSVASGAADHPGSELDVSSGALLRVWQDLRTSGVWRANYYHSSKTLDDATGFLGSTAQVKALPSFTQALEGGIEVRATNGAIGQGGDTRTRLIEGYATVHFARADLHLGKQIIAWGRADGINPTDNVSPRDFTLLLPFEDDQRFGTTALKLDLYLSEEHTLSVLAAPLFEPSEIPLPATLTISERTPAHTLSNTQRGVRLNKAGQGFDWSISYFRGFNLLPTAWLPASGAGGSVLELHYDRIDAFGADFARNFGRFGVRGEVAHIDIADRGGRALDVRSAYLFWIIGVDRTFYEYLNVNLQFFRRRARNYQPPATASGPEASSAGLLNTLVAAQPARVSNGISFRVSHQWLNETLQAEIFAAINLTGHDNSFVRPLLTYAFNDRWKGTIGAELYSGTANSQYGSLKRNRSAFVELRYGF
jgi:hypothetical protein